MKKTIVKIFNHEYRDLFEGILQDYLDEREDRYFIRSLEIKDSAINSEHINCYLVLGRRSDKEVVEPVKS